jgi:hypothetical protein
MRKILVTSLVLLLAASGAYAAGQAQNNVGCGLGSLLWENKADNSLLFQLFMGTTNGTFGSQTFGVTSGTSNCQSPSSIVMNERVKEFILANVDHLAKDIAGGGGEAVSTLAELMEVPSADRPSFYRNLQAHFSDIFPTSDVQYGHVADAIASIAAQS